MKSSIVPQPVSGTSYPDPSPQNMAIQREVLGYQPIEHELRRPQPIFNSQLNRRNALLSSNTQSSAADHLKKSKNSTQQPSEAEPSDSKENDQRAGNLLPSCNEKSEKKPQLKHGSPIDIMHSHQSTLNQKCSLSSPAQYAPLTSPSIQALETESKQVRTQDQTPNSSGTSTDRNQVIAQLLNLIDNQKRGSPQHHEPSPIDKYNQNIKSQNKTKDTTTQLKQQVDQSTLLFDQINELTKYPSQRLSSNSVSATKPDTQRAPLVPQFKPVQTQQQMLIKMPEYNEMIDYFDLYSQIYNRNAQLLYLFELQSKDRNSVLQKVIDLERSASENVSQVGESKSRQEVELNESSNTVQGNNNHSSSQPNIQEEAFISVHHQNLNPSFQQNLLTTPKSQLMTTPRDSQPTSADPAARYDSGRKRHFRRCANEIAKTFHCPYKPCQKIYGSEGSLNLHMKIKHNAGSKTEREKIAKQIVLAAYQAQQEQGSSSINIEDLKRQMDKINMPPGLVEQAAQELGIELNLQGLGGNASNLVSAVEGKVVRRKIINQ